MSEKKHKGGYELLKEKLEKVEAENKTLKDLKTAADKFAEEWKNRYFKKKEELEEAETTIEQQSRKISQLTADLHSSETLRLNADNAHSKKEGEMLRAMGPIRRWWWNLHHLPTFKEDERWNETH